MMKNWLVLKEQNVWKKAYGKSIHYGLIASYNFRAIVYNKNLRHTSHL